jgi:hypothetical protein
MRYFTRFVRDSFGYGWNTRYFGKPDTSKSYSRIFSSKESFMSVDTVAHACCDEVDGLFEKLRIKLLENHKIDSWIKKSL